MKILLLVALCLTSLNSFAGIGTAFGTASIKAQATEAGVVAAAEALMPSIADGSNRSVRWTAMDNNCSFYKKHIKVGNLTVRKYFVPQNDGTFTEAFSGSVRYSISRCRDDR